MRILRAVGNFFIVFGLTVLLFAFYEVEGTAAITSGHQKELAGQFARDTLNPRILPPQSFVPANFTVRDGHVIGRIRIPKIKLNLFLVEGTTLDDLARGPGHYTGTRFPGEPGVVAIAGHRTGWGSPFVNLDRLSTGDRIILQTTYGTFTYAVTRHKQVEPRDTWVLKGDPNSTAPFRLTLTTCTPKFTSLHRLIVWADQISPAPNRS